MNNFTHSITSSSNVIVSVKLIFPFSVVVISHQILVNNTLLLCSDNLFLLSISLLIAHLLVALVVSLPFVVLSFMNLPFGYFPFHLHTNFYITNS